MNPRGGPTEFDQNTNAVSSIPGYVIKKKSSRGAKHGPSERQRCTTRLEICCKKLVKHNMEDIHPYLSDGTITTITQVVVGYWMDKGAFHAT